MSLPKTSPHNFPFGSKEIDYLTRIEAAMQNPVHISTVRMWLEDAQAKGLDPRRLYAAAVHARPAALDPCAVVYCDLCQSGQAF